MLIATLGFANAEPPATNDWRIFLEPSFMRQPVTSPIDGAQKTTIASGRLSPAAGGLPTELAPFSKADWAGLATTWDDFAAKARVNCDADLTELKPEYTRDRKKIIECATLQSEKGLIASAVLAPGFLKLFEATLGPELLVVVPNRNVAYIFPKLASSYQEFAPMVQRAYRETSHPVSLEVFEVTAAGMRAIGVYPDPGRDPLPAGSTTSR